MLQAQFVAAAPGAGRGPLCPDGLARRLFLARRSGIFDFLQQGALTGQPGQGVRRRHGCGLHLQRDRALAAGLVVITDPAAVLAFVDRARGRRA